MIRIRIDKDSWRYVAQTRRYFPEWADRPPRRFTQPESTRNSYSAGGYAEEFGYCVQLDSPTAAPTLIGDPEGGWYWRAQVGALHPGYPECPTPFDREFAQSQAATFVGSHGGSAPVAPMSREVEFRTVRVGKHNRAQIKPVGFGSRLVSLWKELRILQREFGGFRE